MPLLQIEAWLNGNKFRKVSSNKGFDADLDLKKKKKIKTSMYLCMQSCLKAYGDQYHSMQGVFPVQLSQFTHFKDVTQFD